MAAEGVKISALNPAGTLNGNEVVFLERNGVPLKTTTDDIVNKASREMATLISTETVARNTAINSEVTNRNAAITDANNSTISLIETVEDNLNYEVNTARNAAITDAISAFRADVIQMIANLTPAIPASALLEDDGTPLTEDNGEIILDL